MKNDRMRMDGSVLAVLCLAAVSARADVTLNAIFDEHMVLQREIPVSVYGAAEPGEKVSVVFAGQTKSATAGKDGKWSVMLDALKACADSAVMTVSGRNKLRIDDGVVGDVWVCSGQSNMDFIPGAYSGPEDPKPYDEKEFDFPLLRQFHLVNDPSMRFETEVKVNRGNGSSQEDAAWLPCRPETGNRFTAAGLYFGRKLQMETGIPIGLIKTAWNGTRIEPWISPVGLASVPELPPVTGLPAEYKSDGGYRVYLWQILERSARILVKNKRHLDTGMLGTYFLIQYLQEAGLTMELTIPANTTATVCEGGSGSCNFASK